MSKAAKIRALAAKGKTDAEIAAAVGCAQSYVRTAARQRASGPSKSDIKYMQSPDGIAMRRAHNQRYREKNIEAVRARGRAEFSSILKTGNREAAKTSGRVAYHKARGAGSNIKDSIQAYNRAYHNKFRATANLDIASRAARRAFSKAKREAIQCSA